MTASPTPSRTQAAQQTHRTGWRWFIAGQSVSNLGSAIGPIAVTFGILNRGGSPAQLGVILAARYVPILALMLLGGAMGDRGRRSRIMILASLAAAGGQALVAALLLLPEVRMPLLMLGMAITGAANALYFPAASGAIKELVTSDRLQQASATYSMTFTATLVAGAAVGGQLVSVIGPSLALLVDSGSFLVAAAIFLRLPTMGGVAASSSLLAALHEGAREVFGRTWLAVSLSALAVINGAWTVGYLLLAPIEMKIHWNGASSWGIVQSSEAVGLLVVGVAALRVRLPRPLLAGFAGVALLALLLLTISVHAPLTVICAVAVIAGGAEAYFNITLMVAIQQHLAPEMQSRAMSFDLLASFLFAPLGYLSGGLLATSFGIRPLMLAAACLIVAASLAGLLTRSVRDLRLDAQ